MGTPIVRLRPPSPPSVRTLQLLILPGSIPLNHHLVKLVSWYVSEGFSNRLVELHMHVMAGVGAM